MVELEIDSNFREGVGGDLAARSTFGALRIAAGPDGTPLTEVEDTIARTVRPRIYVPANLVAEWLLANWWRLRWEGDGVSPRPSRGWRRAHSLAAIGAGYAWPSIRFSSDGEFVQVQSIAEPTSDVAAVRYLRDAIYDVPAADFEAAVERFVDQVEGRLIECAPSVQTILRSGVLELRSERTQPSVAQECKWLESACRDRPWQKRDRRLAQSRAKAFVDDVGRRAGEEAFAVLPCSLDLGPPREAWNAMRASSTTVDLRWTENQTLHAPTVGIGATLPWQRGANLAQRVRRHFALPAGPLEDSDLGKILSANLPLPGEIWKGVGGVTGGFRNGVTGGRTAVLVVSHRPESQRFYLARVMACALASEASDHLLPVTKAHTALQKLERAFAQELLCPWAELEAYVDEHGTDEEDVAGAAEYFRVSQWLIQTTLVNHGKLPRARLPQQYA